MKCEENFAFLVGLKLPPLKNYNMAPTIRQNKKDYFRGDFPNEY